MSITHDFSETLPVMIPEAMPPLRLFDKAFYGISIHTTLHKAMVSPDGGGIVLAHGDHDRLSINIADPILACRIVDAINAALDGEDEK